MTLDSDSTQRDNSNEPKTAEIRLLAAEKSIVKDRYKMSILCNVNLQRSISPQPVVIYKINNHILGASKAELKSRDLGKNCFFKIKLFTIYI